VAAGAVVRAHDPIVTSVPDVPEVEVCATPYEAAERADAVVLVTEWDEYQTVDPVRLASVMRGRLVIDGRNALPRVEYAAAGLVHESFGRSPRVMTAAGDDAQIRLTQLAASVT